MECKTMFKMKINRLFLITGCVAGMFLSACTGTGTKKELNFNNYTGVDAEAFKFLKTGHYQSSFQVFAADQIKDAALGSEIRDFYGPVVKKIEEIALENNVIVPSPGDAPFEADSFKAVDTLGTDSLAASEAVEDVFAKSVEERVILSQEELVHLTEYAATDTRVPVRTYAREILPEMKALLEKSKAALK